MISHTTASRQSLDIGVFGARGIPSTYSGYETFLTALLPRLVHRGHRVTMYCRPGHITGDEPFAGVRRRVLPATDTKQLSTLSHGMLASIVSRWRRHDVVLVVNVANAAFCLLNRISRQRVVLNTDGQEWLRGKWGKMAQMVFRGSARIAGFATSALISDSIGMRNIYRRLFRSDSTVIPYAWTGISSDAHSGLLAGFGVTPGHYVIIAGRLVPENHIDRVAEAYARSRLDWPLLVLGVANYDSPVTSRIFELMKHRPGIRLVGQVEGRAAYSALIGSAAAYLHAHSVGGINPSLIEAMGSGALTVALDTQFNREALHDTGLYFRDFDRSLVEIFDSVPSLEERHGMLRERSRLRAESVFALDAVADAYERLLLAVYTASPWETTVLPTVWDQ